MISFQWISESEVGLWISDLDFHCKVLAFCILYCQNFWPRMSWRVSLIQRIWWDAVTAFLSNLSSRLLYEYLIQPTRLNSLGWYERYRERYTDIRVTDWEMRTYKNFCFIIIISFNFVSCALFLMKFTLCEIWFYRYDLVLLEDFLFYFNFFVFSCN